ncbi:nitrite reductase small subunit NirD [Marinicrinis lubricantis]|uniref:Nitrite reductase small subunit NirD n=1 Tax=Marinicrinis lubricantis TaxID=2086470 RepID=A0ABW1IK78_9BACL
MTTQTMGYIAIGELHQFPPMYGRLVRAGQLEIAVFHTSEGELYALENRTPHAKGGTLVEGIVSGHYVYCPMRDLKIDLRDGKVQEPDDGEVRTFPVRRIGDRLEMGIPDTL